VKSTCAHRSQSCRLRTLGTTLLYQSSGGSPLRVQTLNWACWTQARGASPLLRSNVRRTSYGRLRAPAVRDIPFQAARCTVCGGEMQNCISLLSEWHCWLLARAACRQNDWMNSSIYCATNDSRTSRPSRPVRFQLHAALRRATPRICCLPFPSSQRSTSLYDF